MVARALFPCGLITKQVLLNDFFTISPHAKIELRRNVRRAFGAQRFARAEITRVPIRAMPTLTLDKMFIKCS
jgi:hypothetical protein